MCIHFAAGNTLLIELWNEKKMWKTFQNCLLANLLWLTSVQLTHFIIRPHWEGKNHIKISIFHNLIFYFIQTKELRNWTIYWSSMNFQIESRLYACVLEVIQFFLKNSILDLVKGLVFSTFEAKQWQQKWERKNEKFIDKLSMQKYQHSIFRCLKVQGCYNRLSHVIFFCSHY